jgi:hypothetical protein
MEKDGVEGVWLPLEAHRLILADLRALPDIRKRVTLLEQKLTLQKANLTDLRIGNAIAAQAKNEAKAALGAAVRGKREAEADRDAWHRSRLLWAGVGLVGGIALAIVAAKLMEAAK